MKNLLLSFQVYFRHITKMHDFNSLYIYYNTKLFSVNILKMCFPKSLLQARVEAYFCLIVCLYLHCLGFKSRDLNMLGKPSITELCPQPFQKPTSFPFLLYFFFYDIVSFDINLKFTLCSS
jgi:hypothetical protein